MPNAPHSQCPATKATMQTIEKTLSQLRSCDRETLDDLREIIVLARRLIAVTEERIASMSTDKKKSISPFAAGPALRQADKNRAEIKNAPKPQVWGDTGNDRRPPVPVEG